MGWGSQNLVGECIALGYLSLLLLNPTQVSVKLLEVIISPCSPNLDFKRHRASAHPEKPNWRPWLGHGLPLGRRTRLCAKMLARLLPPASRPHVVRLRMMCRGYSERGIFVVVIWNVKEARMLITCNGTWRSFAGGGANLQKVAPLIYDKRLLIKGWIWEWETYVFFIHSCHGGKSKVSHMINPSVGRFNCILCFTRKMCGALRNQKREFVWREQIFLNRIWKPFGTSLFWGIWILGKIEKIRNYWLIPMNFNSDMQNYRHER